MNLSTGSFPPPSPTQRPAYFLPSAPASTGRRLRLGGASVTLDRGGVEVVTWPDAASLAAQAAALCNLAVPVVRMAGGALIGDLSLQDNLMLEPALDDAAAGLLPTQLLPEIGALFARAGCPVDWTGWSAALPQDATPLVLLQVRVGRALVADPDVLLVDAAAWDDALLDPARFSQAFAAQYPWRLLVWAAHDAARARALRESLQVFEEHA